MALFAASGLRAGAAPAEVVAASLCFAWAFVPCVALGTRQGSLLLRTWFRAVPRWRGALFLVLTFAGPAAYVSVASWIGPRAIAGLSAQGAGQIFAFELVVAVLTLVRPVERLGYSFALGRRDLVAAGFAFAAFAAVAIPLGLVTGFIHIRSRPFDALAWGRTAFHFVFQVALPEELLFRGLLQNALERFALPRRPWPIALAIAAVIFGAAHLGHPPVPNWRYGILATLAGVAYGWVWHRTRKITASALTHAGVDLVWVLAFGGP